MAVELSLEGAERGFSWQRREERALQTRDPLEQSLFTMNNYKDNDS